MCHDKSKDAAKDNEPKNAAPANSPEFVVVASSFDRLASKLAKKSTKLKKELKVSHKKIRSITKDVVASSRAREEARVEKNAGTKPLPDP